MPQSETSLTFVVRRHVPELIAPAVSTPRELKPLSDIDDKEGMRHQVSSIHMYERDPKMGHINPATIIRDALTKVLVFYYPFAGRLKEGPTRKLMVDCTGEGVLFIEAEADVTLKQFGEALHPPFPCLEELLYDVPGSSGIIDSPLLLIQVTRLLCGGFIIASRFNHTMCDGEGFLQFFTALGEMAQGESIPSTFPVWQRELLSARNPPRVTFTHHEYEKPKKTKGNVLTMHDMDTKSFFFGSTELSSIRGFVPENLKNISTFEMIAATIWRCRTIALQPDPEAEMRFMFPVNARTKFNPALPVGYYGNCFVLACAISTAKDLSHKPLCYALELVMKAKALVSEEYVRSMIDLMDLRGRPMVNLDHAYMMSGVSKSKFDDIDFGWGKASYRGIAKEGLDFLPGVFNYYIPFKNNKDESEIMVPISLPSAAMDIFVKDLNDILMSNNDKKTLKKHKLLVPAGCSSKL
ncbi:benzyl alcohol O-benzoyltransferase [Lactuca sativa]|uniref:benzyl alcohol O-benzoyltransferase n=1 Tax=Lactuca sativa TaxID=4236 RepID=UPI001C6884B7|nr:benzyl alcohol O-benzoyltransferase [Lactuca sativa]